jgi:DNA polymerase-3 subunit gamma/tau
MDAASNNGVDNIRDIRDEVVFAPTMLKYRVYIIDEVHMLSPSAFNALLKTLEEPPAHCIFILATTELHKLPSTIISRCQRFDFRRISIDNIKKRLHYISDKEGFTLEDSAAFAIAKASAGGMRDAISLLELCASSDTSITLDSVNTLTGTGGREAIEALVRAICDKNYEEIFATVHKTVMSSKELTVLWQELMDYYRDMLIQKCAPDPAKYLDLTDHQSKTLSELSQRFSRADILYQSGLIENAFFEMSKSPSAKRAIAELTLVRMCDEKLETTSEALLKRIEAVEEKLEELKFAPRAQVAPTADEPASEPIRVSEPARESSAKPAEAAEPAPKVDAEPVKPVTASAEDIEKKKFRQSAELIEKLEKTGNFMLASFLGLCKFFYSDKKLLIVAESDYAHDLIKEHRPEIAAAVSPLVGAPLGENDIYVKLVNGVIEDDPFTDLVN